jgi:hypothetical protein
MRQRWQDGAAWNPRPAGPRFSPQVTRVGSTTRTLALNAGFTGRTRWRAFRHWHTAGCCYRMVEKK